MFFYVFIDPKVIEEASKTGEMGLGRLAEVLREMSRDCLVTETDMWRVQQELVHAVKNIPIQHERKLIGDLIINLWSRKPFVLLDGDDGQIELIDLAVREGDNCGLDLVLTPCDEKISGEHCWERSSLTRLHQSSFSEIRKSNGSGIKYSQGEIEFEPMASRCFEKLLRHAEKIVIVDYAFGFFGEGQYHNLTKWVTWLNRISHNPSSTEFVIKTVIGESPLQRSTIENRVDELNGMVNLKIRVDFYQSRNQLPHKRFMGADQFWLDIDRGIDICGPDNRCRQVQIGYARRPSIN